MSSTDYRDFILKIEPSGEGAYRVEADGPAGQAETTFQLPFDARDLQIFVLKVGRPRGASARGVPKPMTETADFGRRLFDAVLSGEVRDVFVRARLDAEREGYGLRLKLRLNSAPELADLPWEFLYDGRSYLALMPDLPIVRHLDLPQPPRPLKVNLPLRILVTISAPVTLPELNVAAEQQKITDALSRLTDAGLVTLDFTPDATIKTLQRTLRQSREDPYHVWHFIGHGGFDPVSHSSMLALCDEYNRASLVDGFTLGTLFAGYRQTRLVVMNACEGARPDPEDPFAGVAAALVERGIPAVIGMQFEITDQAAITFADEFYAALVDGVGVEAAMTEARRAIFFLPNHLEWATPVLFLRVEDGQLFEIAKGAPSARRAAPPPVQKPKPVPEPPSAPQSDGDQITVGNITGSTGVAIGQGAQVHIETPPSPSDEYRASLAPYTLLDVRTILPPPFEWCAIPAARFRFDEETDTFIAKRESTALVPASTGLDDVTHPFEVAPFHMAKYPVTYEQFQVFLDARDGFFDDRWWQGLAADADHRESPGEQEFTHAANLPRERVSWWDAIAFCRWLSTQTGAEIRLPTEWEWQWAAQGPDGRQYPWGPEFDSSRGNTREGSRVHTTPVDQYPSGASPYDVLDMSGNVWEWCLNEYDSPGNTGLDGTKPRVVRGGSWYNDLSGARASSRGGSLPHARSNRYGFRVCVVPPSLQAVKF